MKARQLQSFLGAPRDTAHSVLNSASVPVQRRRLPAYGRKLLSLRQRGLSPSLAVLILDGWAPTSGLEEYVPWVVVIPDDTPVALIDFRCIAGLAVYIVADWLQRLHEIALQVMPYRPKAVFGWADKSKGFVAYCKDRS